MIWREQILKNEEVSVNSVERILVKLQKFWAEHQLQFSKTVCKTCRCLFLTWTAWGLTEVDGGGKKDQGRCEGCEKANIE